MKAAMPRTIKHRTARRQQGGMALVAAIFLIVALAGLGVAAGKLSSSQQHSVTMTLQRSRVQAAADSGLEFGMYLALNSGLCINLPLPALQAALLNFTVVVNCIAHNHTLGGITYQVYQLTSRAQYGLYGRPDYVFRQATRTVSNAP